MRITLSALALIALASCATRPEPRLEAPPESSRPAAGDARDGEADAAGPQRLVLREGMLTEPRSGEIFVEIDHPVTVEVQGPLRAGYLAHDLALRLRLPDGATIDAVRAGDQGELAPDDRSAPGLFALREIELWHEPGRRALGVASAGAFLPVQELSGEYARVALPGYARTNASAEHAGAALAWVRRVDLGTTPPDTPPRSDPWSTPSFDQDHALYDAPGGRPFTALGCGPVRPLGTERGWTQVAQLRRGVEVRGWIDASLPPGRGSGACPTRTVRRADDPWARLTGPHPSDAHTAPEPGSGRAVGPGGLTLRASDGQTLGRLPRGSILEAELGSQTGRFRVGPVVVTGAVELRALVDATQQPLLEPPGELADPSPRPPAVWRDVADPAKIGQRFVAQILGPERRLWMRVPADRGGGCRPLSFTRPRFDGARLTSETTEVTEDRARCLRNTTGYRVEVVREEARLTFYGPSFRAERLARCVPDGSQARERVDATGCAWMMQIVGMEQRRVLVAPVGNSVLRQYALEDLGAWYHDRDECEADPHSLISPTC